MEIFIATDTASVQLFFNIFATGTLTFVMPWDQLLNTCLVEVCRMGLEPLCDNHLRCSVILKTLMLTGQEFIEVYEKMEITGSEVRAVGWMIKHLPAELLQ
jgi:hypothetical protein